MSAGQLRYDLNPSFRHEVVASGAGGTGVELDDGRLLYVWVDGGAIKRGWIATVDEAVTKDLPTMTGTGTMATGLAGSVSVARVTNGVGMFVVHKPGGGGGAGVTGSGAMPSLGVEVSYLLSTDDGATWSLVGTGSVGNTGSSIGLGAGVETGPVLDLGGGLLLCSANFYGNYFGDSTPNPGIYRSTNSGASWTAVLTPDGGAFSGAFSRNFAVDDGGVLWWYAKGGGISTPFMHGYYSSDGGATWTEYVATGTWSVNGSYGWDSNQGPWEYVGNGLLYTADPTHAGPWELRMDKVPGTGGPYPDDIGTPALVGVSRDRTVAFAGRWIDLVTAQTGWRVNRIGFS